MTMVRIVSDKRKPRKDGYFYLEGKKPKDGMEVILNFSSIWEHGRISLFHILWSQGDLVLLMKCKQMWHCHFGVETRTGVQFSTFPFPVSVIWKACVKINLPLACVLERPQWTQHPRWPMLYVQHEQKFSKCWFLYLLHFALHFSFVPTDFLISLQNYWLL